MKTELDTLTARLAQIDAQFKALQAQRHEIAELLDDVEKIRARLAKLTKQPAPTLIRAEEIPSVVSGAPSKTAKK